MFQMSRTQIVLKCNDRSNTSQIIERILDSKRYDHIQNNNEDYWKQGLGVTESPKFIRYYFEEDNVILEGWVSNFGKESNLDGFVGALPKKSCKKVLNEIKENIENLNSQKINDNNFSDMNANGVNANVESSANQQLTNQESAQLQGRMMIKGESDGDNTKNNINPSANDSQMQSSNVDAYINNLSDDNVGQNKSNKNSIIPRRYRGSILTNILEILLALFYLYGASTGYMVLRFTDSSEALMLVAIVILIHGVISLILNLSEK